MAVKIKIDADGKTNEPMPLVYVCPQCGSQNIKLTEYKGRSEDVRSVRHTLGVIDKKCVDEQYHCKDCKCVFTASDHTYHFYKPYLKKFIIFGLLCPILLAVIAVVCSFSAEFSDGKILNRNALWTIIAGTIDTVWIIAEGIFIIMDS